MHLVGASGHAKVIIDILELNNITIDSLFDKNENIKKLNGHLVESENDIKKDMELLISIGDNKLRKKIAQKFRENRFVNAIHPTSVVAHSVKIGVGTVLMANTTINPSVVLGDHVIVNTSASVDHDCVIEDFVHIAPNVTLCGGITIGEGTLVGAGVTVIPNCTIGKWAIIGAGAVITTNIPDYAVVVGNPGKVIKFMKQ